MMRAVRVFVVVSMLLATGTLTASAQQKITEGIWEVSACINTLLLPPEYSYPDLPDLGPDLYRGTLNVSDEGDGTYLAVFDGVRADGAKASARARFGPGWTGFNLGPQIIGSERVEDCIVNVGVEYLLSAELKGIGHVDGTNMRVVKLNFGPQGELLDFKANKAPSRFR